MADRNQQKLQGLLRKLIRKDEYGFFFNPVDNTVVSCSKGCKRPSEREAHALPWGRGGEIGKADRQHTHGFPPPPHMAGSVSSHCRCLTTMML